MAKLLPEGFFTDDRMRKALAAYDFAAVFRSVRRATGFSQERLGEFIELSQSRVSLVELSKHRLRDIAIVARVASQFGIPPELLGFTPGAATVGVTGKSDVREVDLMRRREFVGIVTGITMGLDGAPLDLDRLVALLPANAVTELPRRIGAADVAAIEQVTAAFRRWDFSRGGGLYRDAAVAQFRSVLALRDVACEPPVRAQLLVATADLGAVAGWMSYDSGLHDEARWLWVAALEVARQAEHPVAVDLTMCVLLDMIHQALHLHRPEEATRLVQLGYGVVAGGAHPVSACTSSYLATSQAWCDAARGDVAACDRSLGRSVEGLAAEPIFSVPWDAHVGPAQLAARQGHAYYTLAVTDGSPQHAARAVPLLQEAVQGFGPGYARSRAVNLPGLAGAHAIARDLDAAVYVGGQAVTEVTALSSRRALERLRSLDTVLQPHDGEASVAELREQIRGALTAA